MGILACTLTLFGCNKNPVKPDSDLTSISIHQSHMDRTYCYSFCARQENDSFLLDAECIIVDYDKNYYREINFTDKIISKDDFLKFVALDKEYDFCSHIKTKKKDDIFFVCDETITGFYVKYGEKDFNIETNGEYFNKVEDYFYQLAEKYDDNNQ